MFLVRNFFATKVHYINEVSLRLWMMQSLWCAVHSQGIYTGQVDARLQDAWAWMTRFKDEVYPAAYHVSNAVFLEVLHVVQTWNILCIVFFDDGVYHGKESFRLRALHSSF